MFTGLVSAVASVRSLESSGAGRRLVLSRPEAYTAVATGESISCSGVCLTVLDGAARDLAFDVSPETLERSTLGSLRRGDPVNLERALAAGDRLGGHFVSGHVDATTDVREVRPEGGFYTVVFGLPNAISRYVVEKGSISLDGISLTVAHLLGDAFDVAVIPHTWEATTLKSRPPGARVNVEVDVLGKYVERLLGLGETRDDRLARLLAP